MLFPFLKRRASTKNQADIKTNNQQTIKQVAEETKSFEALPAFIPTSPREYQLVSVIATAIAAGENSDSQFVVKRILKRNPEARTVALVAASLAAGTAEDSQLVVTSIQKKK
ncbi:hypothetical protein ACYSNU_11045 [Enterococcus sp. LJL120]